MQDERVRLSEQLAAVMAELRQATEANRQRQELNSQVCICSWPSQAVVSTDISGNINSILPTERQPCSRQDGDHEAANHAFNHACGA